MTTIATHTILFEEERDHCSGTRYKIELTEWTFGRKVTLEVLEILVIQGHHDVSTRYLLEGTPWMRSQAIREVVIKADALRREFNRAIGQ